MYTRCTLMKEISPPWKSTHLSEGWSAVVTPDSNFSMSYLSSCLTFWHAEYNLCGFISRWFIFLLVWCPWPPFFDLSWYCILKVAHAKDSPGVTTFEMEYGHWVEEQNRQICDLRNTLNAHIGDTELQMLVTDGLSHYYQLFRIKATAAKADVFYVMSGMWKTSAERFFLWIGGFRPSELLKVWGSCISQFIGTTWSGNCRIQMQF